MKFQNQCNLGDLENGKEIKRYVGCSIQKLSDGFRQVLEVSEHSDEIINKFAKELDSFLPKIFFSLSTDDYLKKLKIVENGIQKFLDEKISNESSGLYREVKQKIDKLKHENIKEVCRDLKLDLSSRYSGNNLYEFYTIFYGDPEYVLPSMNNERIRRQQGVFIIHPPLRPNTFIDDLLKEIEELYLNEYEMYGYTSPVSRSIKIGNKEGLLKELADVGITRASLFPELDEQAKDIMEKYKEETQPPFFMKNK
ncbi:MAG: hypothetical protein LBU76_06415 [Azoarcus sp.]|nr:hypothetical protein [Azoarcus sp.]